MYTHILLVAKVLLKDDDNEKLFDAYLQCARQGFATALASLLEALPCITVKSVMKLMKKNLDVTSSMKGQVSLCLPYNEVYNLIIF